MYMWQTDDKPFVLYINNNYEGWASTLKRSKNYLGVNGGEIIDTKTGDTWLKTWREKNWKKVRK